ncbi:Aste57867_22586 [Aphanomyces stellatus]|uniref:Aste57867_22586 protein n=1 Tax=Aphanomyces stellatus TaxID=120398 RepID=A0A485LM48_9STRA|nr:hypothetical protein As57867_022516 [Aphanomyces stellatus]VFT99244.1 Aste57867_22586 [Aphanomyces stellatus]
MKLLDVDLPVEVQDGSLVQRQDYSYSWASFMDVKLQVDVNVRLSCLEAILKDEKFGSCSQELLRALAFGKDKHGREVIQITDASTREYLNNRLFYCGRYEIFDGPPVHVSNTAVVVMAYDHGICAQLFHDNKNANSDLEEASFIRCNVILGRDAKSKGSQTREKEKWQSEFRLWDKDNNGSLSEGEFLNFCRQHFGGKLKVAMKFMRNSSEYDREIETRKQLKSDIVVHQLPSVEQCLFQAHLPTLNINVDLSMASYCHVLVMPAADRSLEDIFLKERPDDNKIKSLLSEVLLGIKIMDENGLVHGDLKKLNVLRVQNQLKLIDFDAAVRVNQPLGAKVSSGILPPEMFYNLDTADDMIKYNAYWEHQSHETSKRKKSQVKCTFVVKAFRDGCDVNALPYSLVKATTAVDMWSFGCMVFQMLSGQELVPTDINQNVVLDSMHKAATWTDEKLGQRIDTFIADEDAQDLIKRLLVVDPTKRWSATAALNHPFFTGIKDTSALNFVVDELVQNQEKLHSRVSSMLENEKLRDVAQEKLSTEIKMAAMSLRNEVILGLLEAIDVSVPTSFVVLPYKSLDDVDAAKVITLFKRLWDTGKQLQTVKGNGVGAIVSHLSAGDPLYLYLIDEETGKVVVPNTNDAVYPIEISTRDDNSLLLMNLPFIQSTFKILKKVATGGGWLQRLHVLPSSTFVKDKKPEKANSDWIKEVELAIMDLSEPTASFEVLQDALDEPVAFVRGAALRELKHWFAKHDPQHSFAGLKRVISNQGRVVWTAEERFLSAEKEVDNQVQRTLERIREKFKQIEP